MPLASESPARRRRGAELEEALLSAAWDELVERGYAAFTIDAVAQRAGTSRPVVNRRWATRHDAVTAALGWAAARNQPVAPDTGSLRGDLITFLKQLNTTHVSLAAVVSVHLGAYYRESGTTLADLRETLSEGRDGVAGLIIERAVARGEIDPERLTPRIARLPFDLFRHDLLMSLRPVPDEDIEEIVDTVFLPLIG